MEHRGVPYAVTLDGELADPKTAEKLVDGGYRCLACNEPVLLRQGQVRVPHFAHYADRDVSCNPETVLHEAAKLRLVEMLHEGVAAFHLNVGCPGYVGVDEQRVACSAKDLAERALDVPEFDQASVEVAFGRYRLDAAAALGGEAVLGLEVFQSHQVDEAKEAFLMASGLPWLEVEARAVLEEAMPWLAIRSSFGVVQCPACQDQAARAERERVRMEEARRRYEERDRQARARREHEARIVYVALARGNAVRTASQCRVGATLRCPACKEPVSVVRVDDKRVFLHAEGVGCDPARAWVLAGMYAVYWQLLRDPGVVRIRRRCYGYSGECKAVLTERLPAFEEVRAEVPSLLLVKDDVVVGQIGFVKRTPSAGALHYWWLKPSKAIQKPASWWQGPSGDLCPVCEEAREQDQEERREWEREQAKVEVGQREALERAEARRIDHHSIGHALTITLRSFEALHVDPEWAAERGVIVRPCDRCGNLSAFVMTKGVEEIPSHAEGALVHWRGDREIRCRCMHCGHPANNAHTMFSAPDERLVLPANAVRSLSAKLREAPAPEGMGAQDDLLDDGAEAR